MKKAEFETVARFIGHRIAKRRFNQRLTQKQVAERLGVTTRAISRIERGETPAISRLVQLANLYECGIEDFLVRSCRAPSNPAEYIADVLVNLSELKVSESDRLLVTEIFEKIFVRLQKGASHEKGFRARVLKN